MRASRFVPSRPPVVPYSGPMEPDEPGEPKEPMPLKTKIGNIFRTSIREVLEWETMTFQQ